jgi:hypothetical protein
MIRNKSNVCRSGDLLPGSDTDRRSVELGWVLYSLAVDNDHTFEEVFQLYDMLLDC